jgi:hypothetical protein
VQLGFVSVGDDKTIDFLGTMALTSMKNVEINLHTFVISEENGGKWLV